jgi:large subunit ribosomal protein L30
MTQSRQSKTTSPKVKVPKNSKQLNVQLVRSTIGRLPNHKACVLGLGLRRIGQVVTVENTLCNLGMINKVGYLLKVTEG